MSQRGIPAEVRDRSGNVRGGLFLQDTIVGLVEDGEDCVLELTTGRTVRVRGSVQAWADRLDWTGGPAVRLTGHEAPELAPGIPDVVPLQLPPPPVPAIVAPVQLAPEPAEIRAWVPPPTPEDEQQIDVDSLEVFL